MSDEHISYIISFLNCENHGNNHCNHDLGMATIKEYHILSVLLKCVSVTNATFYLFLVNTNIINKQYMQA